MSGVVDPETLYTKQNCIGALCGLCWGSERELTFCRWWQLWQSVQRVFFSYLPEIWLFTDDTAESINGVGRLWLSK